MASGFQSVDAKIGLADLQPGTWEIVDIAYGLATNWDLKVWAEKLEQRVTITFPFEHLASFRCHDEGMIAQYWSTLKEGGSIGLVSSITESDYLSEAKSRFTLTHEPMHLIVAGIDLCVEAICYALPVADLSQA